MSTREASLAGAWYPEGHGPCWKKIKEIIGPSPSLRGRAGIVPHAGWDYSGRVAVSVFQALAAASPKPELLLLFGTHMAPHSSPHISRADCFETPIGELAAASEIADEIAERLKLGSDPADSRWGGGPDNTIEVQLPLIKFLLPEVKLIVVGPPASEEAIEIGREATRIALSAQLPMAIVGSTDLTHYGARFGFSPRGFGLDAVSWVKEENDARLIARILAFDPEGVLKEARENHNACVPGAVAATLAGARELGLTEATLLDYKTSYDQSPSDTFVGYGAVLFHEAQAEVTSKQ